MSQEWIYTIVYLAWLAGAACFVLGLHRMNSPATARDGNRLSAAGMTVAVVATLVYLVTREGGLGVVPLAIIAIGFVLGGGAGLYAARTVKMTAMPQLVSLFNAVGGGAAALVAIEFPCERTFDVARPRVVPFDEIAVVRIHDAHEVCEVCGGARV